MASIWVPWAPGSPLTVSSPLKAWRVPGMPTVGRYLSTSGVPNGDCGIVFERTCEISYDLALGLASSGAQRCHVVVPRLLAMPSSSPAGQRDCASAPVGTNAAAVVVMRAMVSAVLDTIPAPVLYVSVAKGRSAFRRSGVRRERSWQAPPDSCR